MGREKINITDKKVRITITVDPLIEKTLKDRHINLSSLTNDLLKKYINEEETKRE